MTHPRRPWPLAVAALATSGALAAASLSQMPTAGAGPAAETLAHAVAALRDDRRLPTADLATDDQPALATVLAALPVVGAGTR